MSITIRENIAIPSSVELDPEVYHDVSKAYYFKEMENTLQEAVPSNEVSNQDLTYDKETLTSKSLKEKRPKQQAVNINTNVRQERSTIQTGDYPSIPITYSTPETMYIKTTPNQAYKTIYYTYHGCAPHGHSILTAPITFSEKKIFEISPPHIPNKIISFIPRLDAFYDQEKNEILFFVDLPDFEKKQVLIEFENNVITISGEREESKDKKDGKALKRLIVERVCGFFCRRFCLPNDIVENSIRANMDSGVLKIQIKCNEDKSKKKISIE